MNKSKSRPPTKTRAYFAGATDSAERAAAAPRASSRPAVAVGLHEDAVDPAHLVAREDEHDEAGRPGREALLHPEV
jgi:hypothetical protein